MRKSLPWAAALLIATATVLATAVPTLAGPVSYSPKVALSLITTIAIIATGWVAAENLLAFRAATEADLQAVIDVQLRLSQEYGMPQKVEASVYNLGRGSAGAIEVTLWQLDSDYQLWLPSNLAGASDSLEPSESTRGEAEVPDFHLEFHRHLQPELPHLIIEVDYNDAYSAYRMTSPNKTLFAFDLGRSNAGEATLVRSEKPPPPDLRSSKGKKALLEAEVKRVLAEFDIAEGELSVATDVHHGGMFVTVSRENQKWWMSHNSAEAPVYRAGEALRSFLKSHFRVRSEPAESKEKAV